MIVFSLIKITSESPVSMESCRRVGRRNVGVKVVLKLHFVWQVHESEDLSRFAIASGLFFLCSKRKLEFGKGRPRATKERHRHVHSYAQNLLKQGSHVRSAEATGVAATQHPLRFGEFAAVLELVF